MADADGLDADEHLVSDRITQFDIGELRVLTCCAEYRGTC